MPEKSSLQVINKGHHRLEEWGIMKYEPYKMDSWTTLMQMAYRLGWYGGTRSLVNLQIKGAFEGWSGRASETWEQRFFITTEEIIADGKVIWPGIAVEGETLEEASNKAINLINPHL